MISLRLCGARAAAPASVVMPLLVSDLPVFLRWRGPLPFGAAELGAARRRRRPARRRLARVARRRARPRLAPGALRPHRGLRHLLGANGAVACRRRRPLAGRGRGDDASRRGPEDRGAAPARLARLAPRARRSRLELEPAGEIELVEVDGHDCAPRQARGREPRATFSPTSSRSSPATASTRRPYAASRRSRPSGDRRRLDRASAPRAGRPSASRSPAARRRGRSTSAWRSSPLDWRRRGTSGGATSGRVPPEHPDSNERLAREALLSRVPIPEEQIHPLRSPRGRLPGDVRPRSARASAPTGTPPRSSRGHEEELADPGPLVYVPVPGLPPPHPAHHLLAGRT